MIWDRMCVSLAVLQIPGRVFVFGQDLDNSGDV